MKQFDSAHATNHSIKRTKERTNLKGQRIIKNFQVVMEKGKYADDFSTKERKYLEERTSEDSVALAYEGYCYIVGDKGQFITMYRLPSWFNRRHFDGKQEIRNVKKYQRLTGYYTCNESFAF